jgi:DNA-binding NarL/FixJ family response regulator
MAALLTEAKRQHPSAARAQFDETISVLIVAKDPISQAGVERKLLGASDISVLTRSARRHPDIAIVVADTIDDEVLGCIRTLRRHSLSRIVVVAAVTGPSVALATEAGANGVLPRSLADGTRLAWVIRQVRHGGTVTTIVSDERAVAAPAKPAPAPDPAVSATATATKAAPPVSDRDREVLRLLAEGCDTGEIARKLAYSEPTIKNAIQRLFDQLKARNRPHVVALALRSGII